MEIEKHGRSFLVKNNSKQESVISPVAPEQSREEKIIGLHKSGMCPVKELAFTFGITESEIEKIINGK